MHKHDYKSSYMWSLFTRPTFFEEEEEDEIDIKFQHCQMQTLKVQLSSMLW